jgi:hypothetical protein
MSRWNERIRSTHTSDGGIVLDISKNRMFSLNSSGSVIFQFLENGSPEDQIIGELVRRFGIPVEVAKKDLDEFRQALGNFTLLADSDPSARG